MRNHAIFAASPLVFLAACGGSAEEPPVEQIVVREPDTASNAATPQAGETSAPPTLAAAGEAAFAVCSGCHVAEAGVASMAGPNLHGVFGREAGTLDDFAYSDALSSSAITWDNASLDRFLANPSGYVPGTIMVAGNVSDAETRAAIVAYLRTLSE